MESIEITDLITRLRPFGLDDGEATVYYHLSRIGAARAAELATASQRKRPDTYRLLDALCLKGFAEKTLERPTRYLPIPIETALEHWLEARREETRSLKQEHESLAELWPKPRATAGPTSQRFTVYQGADQVKGLMGRMLDAAEQEVTIVASPGGMARLGLKAMLKVWEGRAAAGVRMRLLTKPEASRHEAIAGLGGTAEIRFTELSSFHQMIIVDAKQIALFVSGGRKLSTQGEEETVLWLNSPDFVLAQKALFDEVWASGVDSTEWGQAEAEQRAPRGARLLRGRWQRIDRMRRMIARATQRVDIVAPEAEVTRWRKGPLAPALARQAKKGVSVTVWTDGDAPRGVHHVRLSEAPNTTAALVDGVEGVYIMGSAEAPGEIAHEGEWSLASNHPDLIHDLERRFASLEVAPSLLPAA